MCAPALNDADRWAATVGLGTQEEGMAGIAPYTRKNYATQCVMWYGLRGSWKETGHTMTGRSA